LRKILEDEGIPAEIYVSTAGRASLLARLKATGPSPRPALLLLHHMDVVPADPSEWAVPPFSAEEKDGSLWGRGALDTKTTGILHLMTLLRLKRERVPLNRDVYLLAVADEETGGHWGAQWMTEHHWDKMSPGFVIDEGGFGLRGVLTHQDATVYAAAVEEKKVFALRVAAEGRSGHGSMPHSENPNDILRRALYRIEQAFVRFDGRPPAVVRELERKLPRMRNTPLTHAFRHNTLTVTSYLSWSGDVGDPKFNVIPSRAVATLDIRLLPSVKEYDLLHHLRRAVDDERVTFEVVKRTQKSPEPVDYRSGLFKALEDAVRRHDPSALVVPFLLPGATDSRFFRAKGAVCLGLAPIVLNNEEYTLLHAANERVPLDRLERGLQIMYDWVKIFCTSSQ
jgi:acetylornithine deacetylase/succinyl-diaminopimelate desuccinylase-like protein